MSSISSIFQSGAHKGNKNNIKDQHFKIMEKSCLIQIIHKIFLILFGQGTFMISYRTHRNGKFLWHSNNSFILKRQLIDSMVLPLASHIGNTFPEFLHLWYWLYTKPKITSSAIWLLLLKQLCDTFFSYHNAQICKFFDKVNDGKSDFQNTVSGCPQQVTLHGNVFLFLLLVLLLPLSLSSIDFFFTSSLERWKFGGHTDNVTETQTT